MTVFQVLRQLWRSPGELLVRKWNWKSAVFSSLIRAGIFFACTLRAGWPAAVGAMLAEFTYRAITAGFYGALTQAFRKARPLWTANVAVMVLLPLASHSLELAIHLLRGTPKLLSSIIVSVCFTVLSTLFNIYAMRRGALIVGEDAGSITDDLRRIPFLIAGFLGCGPLALHRWITRSPIVSRQTSVGVVLLVSTLLTAHSSGAAQAEKSEWSEKHSVRSYNATAFVTIMSVTIFSRSGVGGGFASLDETGLSADRNVQLRFLSGSTPERAHGLNRSGFIEERIHTVNDNPDAISYFGFITANREESLSQAKATLNVVGKAKVPYVAAEGVSRGKMAQYSVRDLLLQPEAGWAKPGELLNDAVTAFQNARPSRPLKTIKAQSAQTTETFLYALIRLMRSGESRAETEFIHNGRLFRLRTEQKLDESVGKEMRRDGFVSSRTDVIRLKGVIEANNTSEETVFRLWFDRTSTTNLLPLRFEFRPRSYLKLVFDAQRESGSALPLDKTRRIAVACHSQQSSRAEQVIFRYLLLLTGLPGIDRVVISGPYDSSMPRSLLLTFMAISGCAVLSATPLYISASGRFASTDVAGPLVSPNANFSLTFVIDSNPVPITGSVTALGFDAPASNFRYTLNGADVAASPSEIRFNTLANGGLFDVVFGSGLGASEFSFTGLQAFTGTSSIPVFTPGQYAISSWTFSNPSNYDFETPAALAVAITPTPEPSSLLLTAAGVAGLGYLAARRSRKTA